MKPVAFTTSARKSFRKLPADVQGQVEAKIEAYLATGAGDVTKLVGSDASRLRSGDYRVVFVEDAAEFTILAVAHRREVY